MIAAVLANGLLALVLAVVARHRHRAARSAADTVKELRAAVARLGRARQRDQAAAAATLAGVHGDLAAEHERLVCAVRDRDEWKSIARAWQDRAVDRLPGPAADPTDILVDDAMAGLDEWLVDLTGGTRP